MPNELRSTWTYFVMNMNLCCPLVLFLLYFTTTTTRKMFDHFKQSQITEPQSIELLKNTLTINAINFIDIVSEAVLVIVASPGVFMFG